MTQERILVISHGHPDVSKGGAEMAAHHLFREFRKQGLDALFLGRTGDASHGGSAFSARNGDHDLLFHTSMGDFFSFRCQDTARVWRDFRGLLERFKPDVVHFHHYSHLGLEFIREARNTCPTSTIVLTLHEFLAICHHNGQMVKTGSKQLCHAANPSDCARCFPEHSPADFFLRERFIKSIFDDVDLFIAPSEFLAGRYRDWGLPPEKIVVLENGHLEVERPPPRALGQESGRGRFAFFGQVTPYKGLDILLQAFALLPEDLQESVHLDIHGANLESQAPEFRERLASLADSTHEVATFHGPYEPVDLWKLMAATDWVIVPSIWWENSPMVIQEAFNHGRPVICSDIGGMAEKVTNGVDGVHFRARNAQSLCDTIARLVADSSVWDTLSAGITAAPSVAQIAQSHLDLYEEHGRDVPAPD